MNAIKTSYFTFGQKHVHRVNGIIWDKDCVAKITAEDPRKVMIETFGRQWSHEYDSLPDLSYYPRGVFEVS